MGGSIALEIAIRYPEMVNRLVIASTAYNQGGINPELLESIPYLTPEAFAGSEWERAYAASAPNPEDWPTLIAKVQQLTLEFEGWTPEDIETISAPTLVIIGDSDNVRPEHATETFRLLGGGVVGDLAGLPASQLAILPGTTHVTLIDRSDWLISMITEFLDAPMPETN
jgi:pimeloyl-ACP methyl ester carboxylesterase